jgi:hypothetical protein
MWFDYRLLSEDSRDLAFIRCYGDGFVNYMKDMAYTKWPGSPLTGFNPERLKEYKHYPTFHILRLYCDKHSIKYDLFWKQAFSVIKQFDHKFPTVHLFKSEAFITRRLCSLLILSFLNLTIM